MIPFFPLNSKNLWKRKTSVITVKICICCFVHYNCCSTSKWNYTNSVPLVKLNIFCSMLNKSSLSKNFIKIICVGITYVKLNFSIYINNSFPSPCLTKKKKKIYEITLKSVSYVSRIIVIFQFQNEITRTRYL